jgi:hypothetical protein
MDSPSAAFAVAVLACLRLPGRTTLSLEDSSLHVRPAHRALLVGQRRQRLLPIAFNLAIVAAFCFDSCYAMIKEEISQKYAQLAEQMQKLPLYKDLGEVSPNERIFWKQWAADARHVIEMSFGKNSTFFAEMQKAIASENIDGIPWAAGAATGIFIAAQDNYNRGFAATLDQRISGEIFGDLLNSADAALRGAHKDSAAVLAAAAFEDSLKKIGTLNGVNTAGKELQKLINELTANQILTGSAVKIAGNFVKTRNAAMHAEWSKITDAEVGALIGFVQQLIAQHLS